MDVAGECILWAGPLHNVGYGRVGRSGLAHRVAWENANGPIPEGMVIHHRCGNRPCVNVVHLECLTHAQHNALHLNAASWYAAQRAKTHCCHGHEYTSENTKIKRGRRHCRECMRQQSNAYHERNRERLLPAMRERSRRYAQERRLGLR